MASTNYRALLYFSRRHTATPSSLFFLRRFHVRRGLSSSSSPPSDDFGSIGFIGLGNMGSRMATNLVKSGYKVTVHDINHDAMKIFADKGVPIKETPLDVAEASDVVISMLPSSSHAELAGREMIVFQNHDEDFTNLCVSEVYTGLNGLLHGGKFLIPWLLIDCSTIDPQTSRRVSALASNCTLKENKDSVKAPMMLDAPVSGGVLAAEAGTLTFMVGGAEEAYLAAKPLLLSMGRSTVYCGNAGNGSAAKICNNLAMAVSMVGISEALALGQSLGIKASVLTQIFNSSSARCWSSDAYNPVPGVMDGVPSSRNYEGGFASKLMVKDLGLAVASANEVGAKHPLASQVNEMYSKICEEGHEMKDFSCVFRYLYSGIDDHDDRST